MIAGFDADSAKLTAYVDMNNIFMTPVTLPVVTEMLSSDLFRVIRVEPQSVTVNLNEINED